MTVFSFHPAKNITTGEGGVVTTNDEKLFKRLKRFRINGVERPSDADPWYYEVHEVTGNYHLTDIQAALGLSQLKRLDTFAEKRRKLVSQYRKELKDLDGVIPLEIDDDKLVMIHLCVVRIDFDKYNTTRSEVMTKLKEKGIGTQVHYIPLYRHPFFTANRKNIQEYFPKTEEYYSQALSLPLYQDLSSRDVKSIINALKKILKSKSKSK